MRSLTEIGVRCSRSNSAESSLRYFSQCSGKRSSFPSGISMSASIWRHLAIRTLSAGRVTWNPHQNRTRSPPSPHCRMPVVFGHLLEGETEFFGKKRTRDLDETQIGDVRDDTSAIGIEKHHLHLRANARRNGHVRI